MRCQSCQRLILTVEWFPNLFQASLQSCEWRHALHIHASWHPTTGTTYVTPNKTMIHASDVTLWLTLARSLSHSSNSDESNWKFNNLELNNWRSNSKTGICFYRGFKTVLWCLFYELSIHSHNRDTHLRLILKRCFSLIASRFYTNTRQSSNCQK